MARALKKSKMLNAADSGCLTNLDENLPSSLDYALRKFCKVFAILMQ